MVNVDLNGSTIHYAVKAKHGSATVYMQPASPVQELSLEEQCEQS